MDENNKLGEEGIDFTAITKTIPPPHPPSGDVPSRLAGLITRLSFGRVRSEKGAKVVSVAFLIIVAALAVFIFAWDRNPAAAPKPLAPAVSLDKGKTDS